MSREKHSQLADFNFAAIPNLNQQLLLELAHGRYLQQASPVIMVGTPSLDYPHCAISLGMTSCRNGHRVRFYTVTALVNKL